MKNLKNWLIALTLSLLPVTAYAQIYGAANNAGSVTSGVSIVGTAGTTETLPTTTDTLAGLATSQTFTGADGFSGGINTNAQAFSITQSKNPLMLSNYTDIPVASVNNVPTAGYQFVSGITGRTIYPMGLTVMVSGTASAATSVKILCGSGKLLATFPIASLITSVPISPYSSGPGAVVAGSALGNGCPSGDGVYASNVGTNLATTTDFYVNLLYTLQ